MAKDVFQYYEEYVSKGEKKEDSYNDNNSLSDRMGKVEQAIASVNTLLEKMIEKGSESNENADDNENVDRNIDSVGDSDSK